MFNGIAPPPVRDYNVDDLWTGPRNLFDIFQGYRGLQIRMSDNASGEAHIFNIPMDAQGRAIVLNTIQSSHYFGHNSPYTIDGNFRIQVMNNPVGQPMPNQVFANAPSMDCMTKEVTKFAKAWYDEKSKTLKNESSLRKAKQPLNNAIKFEEKYADGVPETELSAYSKATRINIRIMTYGDRVIYESPKLENSIGTLKFINTRLNHVELMKINICSAMDMFTSPCKYVDFKEIEEIKTKFISEGKTVIYASNGVSTSMLATPDAVYKTGKLAKEAIAEFEKKNPIPYLRKSTLGQSAFNFGTQMHHNNQFLFNPSGEDLPPFQELEELDLVASYATCSQSPIYDGFVGRYTTARSTDKIVGPGKYEIEGMDFPNMHPALREFFGALGVWEDHYIFDHFELEWLSSIGATYTITAGMWNDSKMPRMHLDFDQQMMEKDTTTGPDPPKIYQVWAGKQAISSDTMHLYVENGDSDLDFLKGVQFGNDKIKIGHIDTEKSRFIIEIKGETYRSRAHLLGQINAYERCDILAMVIKVFNEKGVLPLAIRKDSIVYRKSDGVQASGRFVKKEITRDVLSFIKNESKLTDDCKFPGDHEIGMIPPSITAPGMSCPIESWLSGGGFGKTYAFMQDKGYLNPVLLTPTHALRRSHQRDLVQLHDREDKMFIKCVQGVITSTQQDEHRIRMEEACTIVVDEISMITWEGVLRLTELYPHAKFILIGDVKYQLPSVRTKSTFGSKVITEELLAGISTLYEFKTDMRARNCQRLMDLKFGVAAIYDSSPTKDRIILEIEACRYVVAELEKIGQVIDPSVLKETWTADDWVAVPLNYLADDYTDYLWEPNKPLRLKATGNVSTVDDKTIYKGSIVIKKGDDYFLDGEEVKPKPKDSKNFEKSYAETVHSMQGKTITAPNKVFIETDGKWEKGHIYTAISRAQYITQLFIIKPVADWDKPPPGNKEKASAAKRKQLGLPDREAKKGKVDQ